MGFRNSNNEFKEMFNTETVRIRIFNTYGPGNTLVIIEVLRAIYL